MEISLSDISKGFTRALHRYHVMVFTVFVLGGLALVVFLLNNILIKSSDTSGYNTNSSTSFDEATINRVEQLKTRDQSSGSLDLSHGRTNPFVE